MRKYDLLVVGTSFAASFFLRKYLDKAPATARVLVLERGTLYPHAQRLRDTQGKDNTNSQPMIDGSNAIINQNAAKPWVFQVAFGGNSNCWSACTPRFMPGDFEMKSRYGVATDWPLTYSDLVPYYEAVEDWMQVSGPAYTPYPMNRPYPQPPHLFTTADEVLHKAYGNLYIPQPTARARVAVRGRNACCVSNACKLCPTNAKFTIENGQLGAYEDPRVELVYGAHVTHLQLEGDTVRSVQYLREGRAQSAAAEVVALGANAIFNAHILLHSGDSTPRTGRGLGEQLGMRVVVKLKDFENVGGSTHVTANGYMLYEGDHRKEVSACLIESSNRAFIRTERGKYRHVAVFRAVVEDLPDDRNSVTVTADGIKPQLQFHGHSPYALQGLERAKKELPKVLAALPVEDIEYMEPYNTESHIIGTTRMSLNPEEGVVDRHLVHHRYRNLFVLGSGAFPTQSPANPTLTLSALSMYAADKSF